jgi:uncharacterized repeat protein (TIGR02543 family)
MKYRLVSLLSILFGAFLMLVVAASQLVFFVSTIHFETFGTAVIPSLEVKAGEAYNLPEPTREGYTFGGWYLEEDFQTSANFMVLSNQDRTLYAKWEPNLYTVTFESNGGSDVSSISAYYDEPFNAPEQPVRLGYDFSGWFLDNTTFQEPFTFNRFPLDTTLYAKWIATIYSVTYNLDGGTLGANSPTGYTIEDDLVVFPDASKVGYTFEGWYLNDAFFGSPVVAINPSRLENLTLYAKFEVIQYTITFDSQGGTPIDDLTADFGSLITAPEEPTKRGHTFLGWLLDGEAFVFNTMPFEGADLVASWEVNKYTVTFDVNGGDPLEDATLEVDYDSETDFATPTRTGYQFNGWDTGEGFWDNGDLMIDADFTLTASWSIIEYDIDYVLNQGFDESGNPSEYTVEDFIELGEPQKEGHTFEGWFTEPEFTNEITQINAGSTGDLTLYAKWEVITYSLTLDINDVHEEKDPSDKAEPLEQTSFSIPFAQELVLPTPVWAGMKFLGWEDAEGVKYSTGNLMPSKDLALIGTWEVITYEVQYYRFQDQLTNPNITPIIERFRLGQNVDEYVDPNEGYIFNGWFNSKTDELFVFDFPMPAITEPYILYGKWTPIVYTITFNYNVPDEELDDLTIPDNPTSFTMDEIRENEEPIVLEDPVRPGYDFNGWVDDSNAGVGSVGSPGDRTLTAQWSLVSYNITYDLNGGLFAGIPTTTFNIESNFSFLTPTRTGYNFDGWFDGDGNELTGIVTGMSGDLTVTAQWTIQSYNLVTIAYTGQTPSAPVSYEFGQELNIADPTRRGYDFDGWEESNGTIWSSGDLMPGKNLTLTGQWQIVTYSINYDLNGGNGFGNPTTYTVIQGITLNSNPTRTGWTFAGWDVDGDDTPEHTTSITAGTYAQDLNLTAIWTQNIYTLTYNSAGGSAVTSKTFTYFQSLDNSYFPTPSREGYNFGGWWDSTNTRWAVGSSFSNIGPNGNLNLTARWSPILYSLSVAPGFDDGSGDGYSVGSYGTGEAIYIGFAPYRPGFTFAGWKDLDTGLFYENGDPMPPKDMTLTAQWTV